MKRFVEGVDRGQSTLFPECLEDWVVEDTLYPRAKFYLIVAPQARRVGAPPPEWWLDSFFQHVGRPYYLGLLSAAAYWGSSHQAVQITQVITNRPRPSIQIGRIRIPFYTKRGARSTPTRCCTPPDSSLG